MTAPASPRPQGSARPLPRDAVMAIHAYVAGEAKLPGVNRIIKLSSNEGAFGPPPAAQAAYTKAASDIHRYPDGGSVALRIAIGARWGLNPAQIVCGTGSDELIGLICHVYGGPGTDILMAMHGFTMYQISGTFSGARVIKVPEKNLTTDVDAMIEAVTPETTIVFVAHPNNPTGSLLPQAEITRLRAGLRPDILLVLDSAYAEYVEAADYNAGEALVDAGDNTVMLRTFSKVYGLGGMRVGWGYMPPAVADALNRVRGVFNVNLAAQAAAVAALEEPGWVEKCRAHNTEHRAKITASLNAIGIKTWPSEGNFFLADFQTAARATAADAFLKTRGIIVRAMAAYDLPQCLRITVGTAEECALVTDALAGFMKTAAAHG